MVRHLITVSARQVSFTTFKSLFNIFHFLLGFTKAVDRSSGSDVYSCVDCSLVTASGSYDGSSFDCALGSNIGQPICGANAFPGLSDKLYKGSSFCLEASGAQYVCKCASGYIEAQDGSCITCASVLTAEGGTGSSSSSKLFATGSTTSSCSCGNNARPNVSTQLCECNTNAVVTSEYFNLGKIKAQNCIS